MEVLTPIKSIRAKCLDCTCNQPKEVRCCRVITCALWPYRLGRRPTQTERGQYERQEVVVCED